jgi:hypothetical protein
VHGRRLIVPCAYSSWSAVSDYHRELTRCGREETTTKEREEGRRHNDERFAASALPQ